jgi:predicted GNAT family acetyltransferase
MSKVTDNPAASRFEMPVEGETAFVAYQRRGANVLYLYHAEVPYRLNGKGYGAKLVEGTLQAIRAAGNDKVQAGCSFVRHYMAEHPEFDDLKAPT